MEKNNEYWEIEGYRITDEPRLKIGENIIPPELSNQMSKMLIAAKDNKNKGIVKKLEELTVKYPNALTLKNYLAIAYKERGENEKSCEILEALRAGHPNYLFGKILIAEENIQLGKPEKVKEILGKGLELKELYPERDWFHISELTSFLGVVILYNISINDLKAAKKQLERLQYLNPEHSTTKYVTNKLIRASIINKKV